jgi:hypothetical protein
MRKFCVIVFLTLIATLSAPTLSAYADDTDAGVAAAVAAPAETEVAPPKVMPPTGPTEDAVGDLAVDTVQAVQAGNWKMAVSGLLFLLMFVLRKLKLPFLRGDRGGTISVLVMAQLGAFGTALSSGQPITLSLLIGTVGVGLGAIGGYTAVKKIIWPSDKKSA